MATETGPWRAKASCKADSFPAGISTKLSHVVPTDFRLNLQAVPSYIKNNQLKIIINN